MPITYQQLEKDYHKAVQQRDELAKALRDCVEACRAGRGRWTGGMRCPNPPIDGPKFAHAESLLAKL